MKIEQTLQRKDGSEVRIVATEFFGIGMERSVDLYVLCRETALHDWRVANDRPHPNWRTMSVEEYTAHGRSEMLQLVSHGEILSVIAALDKLRSTVAVGEESGMTYSVPASTDTDGTPVRRAPRPR